jgi:hypothetical protein
LPRDTREHNGGESRAGEKATPTRRPRLLKLLLHYAPTIDPELPVELTIDLGHG